MYPVTHDQQFGVKSKHATDMCIFTLKIVVNITQNRIPLCTRVFKMLVRLSTWTDHFALFHKMINSKTLLVIVRLLISGSRHNCIKWGKSISEYFSILNGVRQGGIFSPTLFAIYMNSN